MKVLLFDAINAAQVALGFVSTILNVINVVLVLGEAHRVVHAPVISLAGHLRVHLEGRRKTILRQCETKLANTRQARKLK